MYYQEHLKIIDTPSSYLDPRQVFTGNYWDEFGWTPYLVPDKARVLMLGLASGGGLRPMLSSTKKIHVTCVDFDEVGVTKCRNFFKKNFPALSFETKVADAKGYLSKDSELYDLIWLDVYKNDSYSELYFDDEFLASLKKHLKPLGVLLTNAYGLPTQFAPLKKTTAQREVARHLQKHFSFVSSLPGRRNQTLVAAEGRPCFFNAQPHPKLSSLDKRSFLVQGMRLRYMCELQPLPKVAMNLPEQAKFSYSDQQMRACWQKLLAKLSKYGVSFSSPRQLLDIIQNQALCETFLDRAVRKKRLHGVDFVPILCAGESFVHDLDVEWIFSWTMKNRNVFRVLEHQRYLQIWLTQLWALVLHPSRKYRSYCFQVYALFEETV